MAHQLERPSFLLLLVLITLLLFSILLPFWSIIFWACVIGFIFHPLYLKIIEKLKGRQTLAALVTLLICIISAIFPALFIMGSLLQQGLDIYQRIDSGELDPGMLIQHVQITFPFIEDFLLKFDIDLVGIKDKVAESALSSTEIIARNALAVGQNTVQFFISLALLIYLAYFMIRDGDRLLASVMYAFPLSEQRTELVFTKFKEVTRATIKGNLVIATIQGGLGGLIFLLLGIPAALLWGVAMIILSLIPIVGASLIWLPAAIYLISTGNLIKGLVLIGFGAIVIGLIDNILRPILVGRDTKLPDYMVLLSTLGGLAIFGINGFIIGPLIAVLFITLWKVFAEEFSN